MPKLNMCQRCGFFILNNADKCATCGIVDNDFCRGCHVYNHRFNTKLRMLGTDNIRELNKNGTS